jgi:hypothetical protein
LATVAEYRVSLKVAMFVALSRASYLLGIPTTDYRALALVRRRLSDDEIAACGDGRSRWMFARAAATSRQQRKPRGTPRPS